MTIRCLSLAVATFFMACASPPPPSRPAMETEKVEPPPEAPKKSVRIQVGGVVTFVVDAVAISADDASLVRVFGQPNGIAVSARLSRMAKRVRALGVPYAAALAAMAACTDPYGGETTPARADASTDATHHRHAADG